METNKQSIPHSLLPFFNPPPPPPPSLPHLAFLSLSKITTNLAFPFKAA